MTKKRKTPTTTPTDELVSAAAMSDDALRLAVEAKLGQVEAANQPTAIGEDGAVGVPTKRKMKRRPRARLLRALKQVLADRARRDFEGLKIYRPQPAQEKFHACRASQVIIRGGNRSGKSTAAFAEFARAVTGQDPHDKYPKKDGLAVLIGYDEKHCRNVFYPRLFKANREMRMIRDKKTRQWRPFERWQDADREHEAKPAPPLIPQRLIVKNSWAWIKKAHKIFGSVKLKNGWEIQFYSSKGKEPQGFSADLILIDEDIETEEWVPEMEGRLSDRKGRLIWSALPKSRNQALLGLSKRAWQSVGEEKPDVVEFVLRFRDNPHIDDDEKRKRIAGWAAQGSEVLKQRDLGEYLLDEFKVFPEFSVAHHGVDRNARELATGSLPGNWCRFAVIDPAFTTFAVLFAAVPPPDFGDYVYLEDELYMKNCSDVMFGEKMLEKTMGKSYHAWIIDLHGSARTETNGKSIRQQLTDKLRHHGLRSEVTGYGFWLGCDDKSTRIMAVHSWLAPRMNGQGPKLRVLTDRMPNFLMEMEAYYKKRSGKIILDEPDDRKDNHLMQNLQYLAACPGVRYVQPKAAPGPINQVLTYLREKLSRQHGNSQFVNLGVGRGMVG